jgi:hypothetical protein
MNNQPTLQTSIIICPGIHNSQLTDGFLAGLRQREIETIFPNWNQQVLVFPTQDYPAYSTINILEFLQHHTAKTTPLVFISFSAGVAGSITAAWTWQIFGGKIKAFIAVDGWGVPLSGSFPIHRLSHDYFTHWSCALLGAGEDSFYADPAVEHLEIWQNPHTCQGWWIHPAKENKSTKRTFTTAADFVIQLLRCYLEN